MSTRAKNSRGSTSSGSLASCPDLDSLEDELGFGVVAQSGEIHRGSHEITSKLVQPLGVIGIDRRVIVNTET